MTDQLLDAILKPMTPSEFLAFVGKVIEAKEEIKRQQNKGKRKRVIPRVISKHVCSSLICQEQYEKEHPLVKDRYKEHNYCNDCHTCWRKPQRLCGCCNMGLRTKARSKKARDRKSAEYARQ